MKIIGQATSTKYIIEISIDELGEITGIKCWL
jgi:uncharacterized protein YuzE